MSNNLGRPKNNDDLKIITVNLEREMINFIDNLAQEHGISRSEFVRGILNWADSITAREAHKSMIVLKELNEDEWVAFDPEIGRHNCYGLGEDPEEALAHFFTSEDEYIRQQDEENTKSEG